MRHYSIFLADGTCFSVTARDAWDAKAQELAICGVTSQASHMRYADELTTIAKVRATLRKAVRMYG